MIWDSLKGIVAQVVHRACQTQLAVALCVRLSSKTRQQVELGKQLVRPFSLFLERVLDHGGGGSASSGGGGGGGRGAFQFRKKLLCALVVIHGHGLVTVFCRKTPKRNESMTGEANIKSHPSMPSLFNAHDESQVNHDGRVSPADQATTPIPRITSPKPKERDPDLRTS
eukprot:gene8977-2954_t